MTRERTDFWVGLFVLLGIIALVFLALRAGNLSSFSFAPTYQVTARFDNVGSLKVRAPVKSSGVVVGRVAGIAFDNKRYQAEVTLELQKQYQFDDETSAAILTAGLLGEQYVGLTPGGGDKMLAQGGRIKYTQSAVVLEDLISKFLYSSASKQGTPGGSSSGGSLSAPGGSSSGGSLSAPGGSTPAPAGSAAPSGK
jgi:phospholipid/cholesterol/gamma-HCH transport system substrate-binding protein